MAITSETKFRPVVGTEEKILAAPQAPGFVYFAEDTGKIFLDTDSENRIVMGGSGSVIFYATDTNVIDTGFDGLFNLHMDSLEDDNAKRNIKEDDLIINSDNCFYRVLTIEEDIIGVTKIAVVGSGGSGSGGGESGAGKAAVTSVTPQKISILSGSSCVIQYNVVALDSAEEETSGGTVTWTLDGKVIETQSVSNGLNSFDVSSYLSTISGTQTLKGTFSLDIGTSTNSIQYKSWNIDIIDVNFSWDYDYKSIISNNQFDLKWTVTGGNKIDKVTHINIVENNIEILKNVITTGVQSLTLKRDENALNYGTYTFELFVSFEVNGETYQTDKISKELIFIDDLEEKGIISLGDFNISNMTQYDTLMIPIYVYNTDNVSLFVDGVEVETWTFEEPIDSAYFGYWSYTPETAGTKTLKIVANGAEKNIPIEVKSLDISISETDGYAFKLKASNFSSNNALKNWIYETPEKETVNLAFSDNFDWVNGGIKTETDENGNLRSYICIKSGTRMILNYKLFKTFNQKLGKDIKIIFKVANCGNYDAEVIKCLGLFNPSADEEAQREIGLKLLAQDGYLYSASNTIEVKYCEDNYIEYEMDIAPLGTQQYIMPWLNGVPAGITVYSSDNFTQHANELSNIIIGSDDCDVYLYLFKVYEKHLTNEEHLENFIMDALNAKEILNRYKRNDVLSDTGNGEIDWKKVLKNNPDCWIHLYKIPRMTKTKKDEVGWDKTKKSFTDEAAKYYALYKDGDTVNPVIQAGTEVNLPYTYKVQGTSSEKYVISAANLDTDFKSGMINADGETISNFKLDDTVPGEKYFNSKVNVASCEGANNALNVNWYNKYQPYQSYAKKQNSKIRDTMLFKPGIIFMIDENSKYEKKETGDTNLDLNIFKGDENYEKASEKFYKQYAICNFGNSKKNINTLHLPSNKNEICIEVTDNQNIGQRMTAVMGRDNAGNPIDITNENIENEEIYQYFYNTCDDKDYDIRYVNSSDGVENASETQLKGFFKLVQWFAKNDPCQYDAATHPYGWTGEELVSPVTYEAYTFKSKDWKNDDTVLGGLQITKYAGTYTHDTHEYRMAKLLAECEDHLIMDSIVYHYLFIERHLMVDNVAKNTFWTSEDENNQYWCLIKDYDNDTADGIDNDGKLAFTYGIEPGDTYNGGLSYFNAEPSVWFNFLQGLYEVNRYMYQTLGNSSDVWSAKKYLEEFTKWQNCIPERCWIEDYYRKYIRPFEIYNDDSYLNRLEGGKKELQRAQFETYQEIYMNTKYEAKAVTDSYIYIRANATDISGVSIPVSMYSDCYIYQSWSQNIIRIRAKRGEVYNITCPDGISGMGNATVYWYAPSTYSTIGNIGELKPQLVNMSESIKLQKLEINGTASEPLESLADNPGIGQAILIKDLKLNYLSNLNNGDGAELNLTNQKSLSTLETIGSNFTSLILPEGAPISSIKANDPRTIKAKELRYLSEFSLQNYSKLNSLYINNIDESEINSLDDLVLKIGNNLTLFDLENVKWFIDDASQIDSSNYTIDILEKLKDRTPMTFEGNNSSLDKALTGSLVIGKNAYSGANALNIYEKYIATYPNLDINFEDENSTLYTVTIVDGNGKEQWSRKFQGSVVLEDEFFETNPSGALSEAIDKITIKASTSYKDFTFANKWIVNSDIIENASPISDKIYIEDIIITPIFNESDREYTVSYYNEDGTELFGTVKGTFGTLYSELDEPYAYKDDSSLPDEMTYSFLGWSKKINNNSIISSKDSIHSDISLYAVFEQKSVYSVEPNLNLFEFNFGKYYDDIEEENIYKYENTTTKEGYSIKVKDGLKLKGKITLPTQYQNKDIINIEASGFSGQDEITHIYWHRNNISVSDTKCLSIGKQFTSNNVQLGSSFWRCSNLKYFELPECIRIIGNYSFAYCQSLTLPNFEGLDNLLKIGTSAYYLNVQDTTKFKDMDKMLIPASVKHIGNQAFSLVNIRVLNFLQFGEPGKPTKLTRLGDSEIKGYPFCFNTGSNDLQYIKAVEIYYDNSNGKTPPQWTNDAQYFIEKGIMSYAPSKEGSSFNVIEAF